MHLFMNTFVKLLNAVRTIVWCHGDETVHSNVSVVCCCVDAPARASLFKMKRYNGYYGCPWCLLEASPNGGMLRYISGTSPAAPRTHTSVLKDMRSAYARRKLTRGVGGPSPLLLLKGFSLVWCMPPDYMHCVFEGVTMQITELRIKGTSLDRYIKQNLRQLETRISKLKPPVTFCRLPRPIRERTHWNATEWSYWLLFCSLPCMSVAAWILACHVHTSLSATTTIQKPSSLLA